jgi:hypothetical protein
MVDKLMKVYTNDTYHQDTQQHLPLAYSNAKISPHVSQCAMLNIVMSIIFHFKKITYTDK